LALPISNGRLDGKAAIDLCYPRDDLRNFSDP
jgi:hypothetical protein